MRYQYLITSFDCTLYPDDYLYYISEKTFDIWFDSLKTQDEKDLIYYKLYDKLHIYDNKNDILLKLTKKFKIKTIFVVSENHTPLINMKFQETIHKLYNSFSIPVIPIISFNMNLTLKTLINKHTAVFLSNKRISFQTNERIRHLKIIDNKYIYDIKTGKNILKITATDYSLFFKSEDNT